MLNKQTVQRSSAFIRSGSPSQRSKKETWRRRPFRWSVLRYNANNSPELQLNRQDDASRSHHPPPPPPPARLNDRLIVVLKSTYVIKSRRKFAIQKHWWCTYAMIDLWSFGEEPTNLPVRPTIYFLSAPAAAWKVWLCRQIHDKHFSRSPLRSAGME